MKNEVARTKTTKRIKARKIQNSDLPNIKSSQGRQRQNQGREKVRNEMKRREKKEQVERTKTKNQVKQGTKQCLAPQRASGTSKQRHRLETWEGERGEDRDGRVATVLVSVSLECYQFQGRGIFLMNLSSGVKVFSPALIGNSANR